ncbi:MAG: alpha/beta hydrolase [Bacillus thermozeamaize]|uniref:Alpha/beta hydrolase n=1 Tax=Bacillus thermozeamaize TaxID=230954 RepID=A0A1Y3PXE7_9BACI|nr:MAG: alpha/beta hydrolase [Bacillus thermozeamaize]
MYIEVEKGVRIFVQDLNPGMGSRPVVFAHGWPLNHKMFEYQYNVLPRYGFRCLGIDQRGFGQSDKPWHGYSYDRLADDLHAVLEALQLEDTALVGFSIGGAIAIRYMARHGGHRIGRLALVDAAAPVFTKRPDYPYGLPVEQVNDLIRQTYQDRPQMLTGLGRIFFNRNVGTDLLDWFHNLGLEGSSHATIQCLVSLRDEDLRSDLGQIHVPTAIFHGVHDRIVPFPSALVLQREIAGSHLYPFYNSGHGVVIDEMDAFNAALLRFLQ